MNACFASILLLAVLVFGPPAQALGPEDTEVILDKGNIELSIIDGTTLSVAAGTHLTIEHAKGPGQPTRINVLKGEFRVSNVFHKHSGLVLIRVGGHAFELDRGTALVSTTSSGPQATLLHGRSLGLQGEANRLTTPGMRLNIPKGGGAVRRERPSSASINKIMNKVSGRKPPKGIKKQGPKPKKRVVKREPNAKKKEGSRVLKRSEIKTLTDKIQGAGKKKPPKPPRQSGQRPPRPPQSGGQGMGPSRPPHGGGQGMGPPPSSGGQGQGMGGPRPPHGGQGNRPPIHAQGPQHPHPPQPPQ